MLRNLYARTVLWLIRPALELREAQLAKAVTASVSAQFAAMNAATLKPQNRGRNRKRKRSAKASPADNWQLSRSTLDSPLGKLVCPLKTDVDSETGEDFKRMCIVAGTTYARVLRDVVYQLTKGKSYTDICHDAAKVKQARFFGKALNGFGLGSLS